MQGLCHRGAEDVLLVLCDLTSIHTWAPRFASVAGSATAATAAAAAAAAAATAQTFEVRGHVSHSSAQPIQQRSQLPKKSLQARVACILALLVRAG